MIAPIPVKKLLIIVNVLKLPHMNDVVTPAYLHLGSWID